MMFDWLLGNSKRIDRILEDARKPLWVIPRWAVEDANAKADAARLQAQLDIAQDALKAIVNVEYDILTAADIAADALAAIGKAGIE
jgi:cell division septum initiation protein DivIVA